jgi:pyruvate dehydrogenase E1 component
VGHRLQPQSLDAVVSDRLFGCIDALFEMMGWRVVTLKYGRLLEAAFAGRDGHHLREWIDDLDSVLSAFHPVEDDRPTCSIAYTIKAFGLPFAGRKDNHAGWMNLDQMASVRRTMEVAERAEWEPFAERGLPAERLAEFLPGVPSGPGAPCVIGSAATTRSEIRRPLPQGASSISRPSYSSSLVR